MSVTPGPDRLQTLSRWLDAALKVPPERRAEWLATLPDDVGWAGPYLRRMLETDDAADLGEFLATLPKFELGPGGAVGGAAAVASLAGQTVGPYRLEREIGRGGMSVVWLAMRSDGQLKRPVALKLPHLRLNQRQWSDRFARERDILAGLTHPHIARLYDAGLSPEGQPYLAMEFVEGVPLAEYCDSRQLTIEARLTLFLQVLAAVQYAHAHLVIHRDLKPSNILVTADGRSHLLDFGIAKLLTEGAADETLLTQLEGRPLTPGYASPEQIAGQPLSTASDVYSLGVVLYELITGVRPYVPKRDSRGALEEAILDAEPPRPSRIAWDDDTARRRGSTPARLRAQVRGDLETIVLHALKKAPQDRYATAEAFARDLRRLLGGETVLARADGFWYRTSKLIRRHRVLAASAATVVLALATGLGVALWQARVARQQAAIARIEAHTAEAVQAFLERMFQTNTANQPDPAQARNTTARELLDIGARQIGSSLNDTPAAKYRVLKTLINMYDELGLSDKSMELERTLLPLGRSLHRADSPELAQQLVEYGNTAARLDLQVEARDAYRESEAILDRRGDRRSEVRAKLESALAYYYDASDPRAALVHADRAIAAMRALPGAPSVHLVNMLSGKGYNCIDIGDFAAAHASLSEALAEAERQGAAANDQRQQIFEGLGYAEAGLDHLAAAEAQFRRAAAIAETGVGGDLDKLETAGPLGDFLIDTSRVAQGLEILERANTLALSLTGPSAAASRPIRTVMRYGRALVTVGRLEEGMAALARAERMSLARGDDELEELNAQLYDAQAMGYLESGDYGQAGKLLERAAQLHARVGEAGTPYENPNIVARVRLLLATNRPGEAVTALQGYWQGPTVTGADGAAAQATRAALPLRQLRGEIAFAQSDWETARSLAAATRGAIAGSPNRDFLKWWEMRAARLEGAALGRLGRSAEALPLLTRAAALGDELYGHRRVSAAHAATGKTRTPAAMPW